MPERAPGPYGLGLVAAHGIGCSMTDLRVIVRPGAVRSCLVLSAIFQAFNVKLGVASGSCADHFTTGAVESDCYPFIYVSASSCVLHSACNASSRLGPCLPACNQLLQRPRGAFVNVQLLQCRMPCTYSPHRLLRCMSFDFIAAFEFLD